MSHLAFKYLALNPALKQFLTDLLMACAVALWPVPKARLARAATRYLRRGRRS